MLAGRGYREARVVGDYIIGRQIGSGSFSVVWSARHRVTGMEVAVKEMSMDSLSKKLQESLLSEIKILERINHPNIIALHDIIEANRRIYIVLEYCKGGDLSMYLQRHGRVPEATAKHFMQQLATGLQVLREHNLIHRDLKPQNLLLSTTDEHSVLKIADFGFARSLQPRGLAETLCGSPLYMAPEIMQLKKYDAKADLWSVGAILFQLVTGKTPFTGGNQVQLLQNIVKSSELQFPPDNNLSRNCVDLCQKLLRLNPVERLTFEEFFNHPFLSEQLSDVSQISSTREGLVEYSSPRNSGDNLQEECLPFPLDDESSMKPSTSTNKGSFISTYGFAVDKRADKFQTYGPTQTADVPTGYSSVRRKEPSQLRPDTKRPTDGNLKEARLHEPSKLSSRDAGIVDSFDSVIDGYVIVPDPPLELSTMSISASKTSNSQGKSDISIGTPPKVDLMSAPIPIYGTLISKKHTTGSFGRRNYPAPEQGSKDVGNFIEEPSLDCVTRIRSLQNCALLISELVKDKIEKDKQLEAFSLQLVILAIWKQAMHICHAEAASATEGSTLTEGLSRETFKKDVALQQIEKEFLVEVGRAEELARDLGRIDAETMEMPDAMETIFQSALSLGRHGAVGEMMENMERASTMYSKAVGLLYFILVEAPSLILNPPFTLTNSDRYRLLSYIDILKNRQNQSSSQRIPQE